MYLLYVGLTHKQTPIEIREKIHFSKESLEHALNALKKEKSILENVIVSTCNRTELYLVVDQIHTGKYYAKMFLANWFGIDAQLLKQYLVFKEDQDVFSHLLRVSVGLESKVIGETQILGQLKQAFERALQQKTTGILLNYMFKQAVTFSKQTHETYRINDRPASVSLTAMQKMDALTIDYTDKTLAILGMGKMGTLVAKYTLDKPFKAIKLVNRTVSKAEALANQPHISSHGLTELEDVVKQSDIVFSALTTDTFVVLPHMIKKGSVLFDLGVPRTIHPTQQATIFDIDQLTLELDQYNEERLEIAHNIQADIESTIFKFDAWRQQLGIVPLIKELRERSLKAQEEALESLMKKIPHLTDRERLQVQKHMKSIVNQILKEPILQLKEMSVGENSSYDIALVAKIFGLSILQENDSESN